MPRGKPLAAALRPLPSPAAARAAAFPSSPETFMKRLVLAAAALAAAIVVPTLASGPAEAALANKSVAVANAVNVSAGAEVPTNLASVDLDKALKHRILVVSGTATTTDP